MDTHIVIGDIAPRIQYVADGTQTRFVYPFPIFENSDLQVFADEIEQQTGFTVSGAGLSGGGDVTFDSAPQDGTRVTLLRKIPIRRTTDFQAGGAFRAATVNDELDRQTAMIQQVADEVGRSLTIDPTDPVPSIALPPADARAGKVLAFDISGAPLAVTNFGKWRGDWLAGRAYVLGDVVRETAGGDNLYICLAEHVSADFPADLAAGKWALAIDVSAVRQAKTDAQTAAAAAAISETNAANSETNAASSAGSAANSAAAAATSAGEAASFAAALKGTSTTSLAIELGTKTFTTEPDRQWDVGQYLLAIDAADDSNWMVGQVVSYGGTTLEVDVTHTSGGGTVANWLLYVSGPEGPTGPQGPKGVDGDTIGTHTLWLPASSLSPRITDGPATRTREVAGNGLVLSTLEFDPATAQSAQAVIGFPKSWDEGPVSLQLLWTAQSGSGDVVWSVRGRALNDDDGLDLAFGASVTVADTLLQTDDLHGTAATPPMIFAGTPLPGGLAVIEIRRAAGNAADTLGAAAQLIGARLFFTVDAANDD